MSSQKGNISRSRPQKHKNKTAFKNNLHDTSHIIKQINAIEINNVCGKCKGVLEWKIKYKKYKLLKAPSTCVTCHLKTVKHPYHTLCTDCAQKAKVCPKCGKQESLVVPSSAAFDESILKSGEFSENIKKLSERRRRTFHRFVKKTINGKNEMDSEKSIEEILMEKLKEMCISSLKSESDDLGSDFDEEFDDDDF